jgi:hypothetical protein
MDILPYLPLPAVALLIFLFLWLAPRRPQRDLPYTKRASLLSAAELRFYRALLRAVADDLVVFVKVRLMDVLEVDDDSWQQYGAPGSGMHLDFVLADPETMAVVLAVELDDRSHWGAEARKRDLFKDSATASAGVPLRVRAARQYEAEELRDRIAGTVGH